MSTTSIPVSFGPSLYVNNLQLAWASNTTLTVAAGVCRDSTNVFDLTLSASTTLNAAVNGINGLDTGTFAASSQYHVFVIADPTGYQPTGVILSLSATTPYLPFGYAIQRRIGSVRTDGSTHFLLFYQSGNGSGRTYQYDVPIQVLNAGAAQTFTAVSLATAVPLFDKLNVIFNALYVPAGAADTANIRPTGSSAAAGSCPVILKNAAAVGARYAPFTLTTLLATGNPSVDYINSAAAGALTLNVVGYVDSL